MTPAPEHSAPRRVEAYLDQVLAPLARRLSAFQLGELRRELRAHLFSRVDVYRELGHPEDDAVTEALRQFGGADDFVKQWRQEWATTTPQATLREIWAATRCALLLSLPALLITCLGSPVWSHTIYEAQIAWAPEWMRSTGFTQATSGWASFGLDLIILPIIVGTAVGRLAPQRAALGMLTALTIEIVLTDWIMLPIPSNLNLGPFAGPLSQQIFFCSILWLPLACAAASVSGWWTQHRNKREVTA